MEKFRIYKGGWQNVIPHKTERINLKQAQSLLKEGGLFVRNVFNWDKQEETSFWYVVKDQYGGIEELPTKVRNQVRKSQKSYNFRLVSPEEMYEKGFELFNASRFRFGDDLSVTKELWAKRIKGGKGDQDFWLAIDKETGKAEGFGINRIVEDYCCYVSMGVNPDAPKSTYPMYGLILEMNRYYLDELKLKYVSDGARSITEHSNIQPFLEEKFKFRKAYCNLQMFYKPWLGLVVKILYPFRKVIRNKKIRAFLYQEQMAKGVI